MSKKYCENCGKKIIVVRRVQKPGYAHGKQIVFADRNHTLCYRCHSSAWNAEIARQIYIPEYRKNL